MKRQIQNWKAMRTCSEFTTLILKLGMNVNYLALQLRTSEAVHLQPLGHTELDKVPPPPEDVEMSEGDTAAEATAASARS